MTLRITQNAPLILASSSRTRREMLGQMGIDFDIMPAEIDETLIKQAYHRSLPELALALADAKAEAVSRQHRGVTVIGADQVCDAGGKRFSKPVTEEEAIRQLRRLSGRRHQQHSAVTLYRDGERLWHTVETATLTLRPLTENEITAYVRAEQPLQACGSYHYEALGKHLFAAVEGSDAVVQGMPLVPLLAALYEKGILTLG